MAENMTLIGNSMLLFKAYACNVPVTVLVLIGVKGKPGFAHLVEAALIGALSVKSMVECIKVIQGLR